MYCPQGVPLHFPYPVKSHQKRCIARLAASQASLSFVLPQALCLFLIDTHRVGIVGDLVDSARAPVGDDLCFDILNYLLRIGIEWISVAGAPGSEAEGDDIALVVRSDRPDEWFISPFPANGLSVDERRKIQVHRGVTCAHALEDIGTAHADARHSRRRIAAEERLGCLHFAVIGDRRKEDRW